MSAPVPKWLDRAAAIGWRLLVVGAVVFFGFILLRRISIVVLAVVLALFPAAILTPPVQWLKRKGWPPILATWTVLVAALALMVGIGSLVVPAVVEGVGPIVDDLGTAFDEFTAWLATGPLGLSESQVQNYIDFIFEQAGDQAAGVGSGLLAGAGAVFQFLTGAALAAVVAFFLLKDGDQLVTKLLRVLGAARSDTASRTGRVAWRTLSQYVRALALTGLFDAVGIGIGLAIVGVPLVLPLSILVFFGAFFPVVGAFASGLVAVAVALVNGSLTDALIVLGIVIAIQQIEGNVIYPMVFGRTMELHPLVVLLALAAGGVSFGIVGAFLAVPITAVVVAIRQELAEDPDLTLTSLAQNIY